MFDMLLQGCRLYWHRVCHPVELCAAQHKRSRHRGSVVYRKRATSFGIGEFSTDTGFI